MPRPRALVFSLILCLAALISPEISAGPLSRARKNELDSLNKKGGQKGWTFKTGYHEVLDYDTNFATGLVMPDDWSQNEQFILPRYEVAELPVKWDWREQAVGGLTPIKNQGPCGSCWAFATAAVMESQLKIRDNVTRDVSEQHILACNRDGASCRGGWFEHKLHVDPGVVWGADFPYVARMTRCKPGLAYHEKLQDWAYLGTQGRRPSDTEIKAAIYKYGPVGVTVAATRSFMSYRGGVYNACDGWSTNHAVSLVGWDDGDQVWILRNTWGERWGENGYMRIKYGCNRVGERTTFVTYKTTCAPQPIAYAGENQTAAPGEAVRLGDMAIPGQKYSWTPSEGLDDPSSAMPEATPGKTTTYLLTVENACGKAESSTTVTVGTTRALK